MRVKLLATLAAFVLALTGAAPGIARSAPAPSANADVAPVAAPGSPVDETKVPHYFGPYPNWANSPMTQPDAVVTITAAGLPVTPITVGNGVTARQYASDDTINTGSNTPGQGTVLVVVPTALPAGTLTGFKTFTQNAPAAGLPSPGNTFSAYVLRPTGTAGQFDIVFDSGPLTVPAEADGVHTWPVSTPVQQGDQIAFYGQGIPLDLTGADFVAYPVATAPTAPVDTAALPAIAGRTYSFAATVVPPSGPGAGAGATAEATVGANGAITGLTITNPGHDYAAASVAITGAGTGATADATVQTSGAVTGIAIDQAGSGYTAPSVAISGGGATTDATAHALGGVDAVTVGTQGEGYTFPNVDFDLPDDPAGLQAQGHAVCADPYPDCTGAPDVALLTVTGIVVDSPGSGYAAAPGVAVLDGTQFDPVNPGAGFVPAAATATLTIQSVAIDTFGAGYTSAPAVAFSDTGAGTGAAATASTDFGSIIALNLLTPGTGYITPGGIKKFVDGLPGLTEAGANNLGQYIPLAQPDTTTFPGTDYYVIGVMQHRERMSSSLPAEGTMLREYVQLSTANVPGKQVALMTDLMDGTSTPTLMPDGTPAIGVDNPHYLGPTIVAQKDRAVRIVFYNLLPSGEDGDLFLPTDTTLMGSGVTPASMDMPIDQGSVTDAVRNPMCTEKYLDPAMRDMCFTENRATLHLHGGVTPWISDGTPHQWITPASETTPWPQGVSVQNVPDMIGASAPANVPDCNAADDGCQTFYYTNEQSARLMFYHDHAWGITRLNVYAGEAAGYVITDPVEQKLFGPSGTYADMGEGIPLVIQDRTFVPSAAQLAGQDPTWDSSRWGGMGNLWYHHVYMPAQNPGDPGGMSAYGRWMYGPWFWPPATPQNGPIANPYYGKDPATNFTTDLTTPCSLDDPLTWQYQVDPFCEPKLIPGTPNISVGMEQFNDTPLVNGTAYPTTTVQPKSYRFRILNAANDRFWNLQWYLADDQTPGLDTEVALKASEVLAAQTDPVVFPTPDTTKSPVGPSWIQIGTEGGFLPAPVVVPNQPTTWITDPTRFDVGNVDKHSLLLAPAERADTIVDFSKFAGKTLILYNDAPAAFPARVASYDYYTGGPDGLTLPGYGPNTRTVMQVKVAANPPATAFNVTTLSNAFKHHADGSGVFEAGQHPIIVGQAAYNSAYGKTFAASGDCTNPAGTNKCDGFARINQQGGDLFRFDNLKASNPQLKIPLQPKALHDEMNSTAFDEFGRMTANLGLEAVPATPAGQNIMLFPYVAPPTEVIDGTNLPKGDLNVQAISDGSDGTQIWKITHNGVDTHPIHFHLYDVQVVNRVTWDNIIIPTEASELGWKDTVRISPLEDTIVALRPIVPTLPFEIPNSIRRLSPMMGDNADLDPTGLIVDPSGNITTVRNALVNFGWEYVYHCHILSHEEMDMMRPVLLAVPPLKADTLTFDRATGTLTFNDNSITETSFEIQRAVNGTTTWTTVGTIQSPLDQPNIHQGRSIVDASFDPNVGYQYHVIAKNTVGYGGAYPQVSVMSVSDPITTQVPTSVSLTSDINPSFVGQLVTFTATVSPSAASGTVQFFDGTTSLGTGTLTAGVASLATATLVAGSHSITASYLADAAYAASTSAVYTQLVDKSPTTTVVVSSLNPSFVGDTVTFTASVSPALASGTVTFTVDGTDIASPSTVVAGDATFTTSGLTAGDHTISATYSGDAAYLASTSDPITQTVNKTATAAVVTSNVNPSVVGQNVTFTATVSPSAAGGSVTFSVDGVAGSPVTLVGGLATFSTTSLAIGAHPVIATYSGDAAFLGSQSTTLTQTVGPVLRAVNVVVTSNRNPTANLGQSITFTAAVAPVTGAGIPAGTVQFSIDGVNVGGLRPLNAAGRATYTTNTLGAGPHFVIATYGGSAIFAGGSSAPFVQQVNQGTSTTVVTSNRNPASVFGQSVTFTARVTPTAATGTVQFSIDGTPVGGPVTLNATGRATLVISTLAVGSHTISAAYGGNINYLASNASLTRPVNKANSRTVVTTSGSPARAGTTVVFTATVTAVAPGAGIPSGTVQFRIDGVDVGSPVALNPSGQATFATSTLTIGLHAASAVYAGDTGFNTSTSANRSQRIN